MKEKEYVNELLKNKDASSNVRKAITLLEDMHIFSYLREMGDNHLRSELDNVTDTMRAIVASAKHAGYAKALDDIQMILQLSTNIEEGVSKNTRYGVKEEDLL